MTIHCRLSVYCVITILEYAGALPTERWSSKLLTIVQYGPGVALMPRFIISIRELHARELRGACGSGIDTGFGLSTRAAGASVVVFADIEQNRGPGDEIEMVPIEKDSQTTK